MIREYLIEKGVDSVDKLTDSDVKEFFLTQKFDIVTTSKSSITHHRFSE